VRLADQDRRYNRNWRYHKDLRLWLTKESGTTPSQKVTGGEQGTYTLENERWIFKDDRPLKAPALRTMAFRYREDYRDVRHVLAFNDFQYTDCTEVARTEYTIFQPFQAKPEESPALYLGFVSRPFATNTFKW